MTKLTHLDKDRMLTELRDRLYVVESALQAANAQIEALATPPASESIAAAQQTLEEHEHGENACTKCNGTGRVELESGETGTCYTCRGKGYITARDARRNDVYALHRNIAQLIKDGKATKFVSRAEIAALHPRERAGKRVVEHNGWLVLV